MTGSGSSTSDGPFSGMRGYDAELGRYQATGRASASGVYPGTAGAVGVLGVFAGFVSFCLGVPVVIAAIILLGSGALIAFGYHRERAHARQVEAGAGR